MGIVEPIAAMVGSPEAMRLVIDQIRQVAPTGSLVLVLGEIGVGTDEEGHHERAILFDPRTVSTAWMPHYTWDSTKILRHGRSPVAGGAAESVIFTNYQIFAAVGSFL
jgi:hypothetical protein